MRKGSFASLTVMCKNLQYPGNSEATILRCDSPATLLMSKYLAIEGKDYIGEDEPERVMCVILLTLSATEQHLWLVRWKKLFGR